MRLFNNIYKIGILASMAGSLFLSSCEKDLPEALDTSGKTTVLESIKILNAGANGTTVMEGVVDEATKIVTFPRIEPTTDFSNLKFEAVVSDGATLIKDTYSVTFPEGKAEQVVVLKVVNEPRYREYIVKLRLKVPVFGADFENKTTFDYSNNADGNPMYPTFTGAKTRGTGFDGEKVLIIDRTDPHLLNVSDLKAGTINKIPLNTTGVSGGTFTLNMGAQINGHTYIASLSGGATSPLKIYHWTDPSVAPQVILDVTTAGISGAGIRNGDNMSVNLDAQGTGYIFFGDNAGTRTLRYDVTNYTTVNNPVTFPIPVAGAGSWTSYNRVGNSGDFIFTGHNAPVAVISEGGAPAYTMSKTSLPLRGSDARIVSFNAERYLILTVATGPNDATALQVYDITRGSSVKEALAILNDLPTITPVFQYVLAGATTGAPSAQTGFFIKKDGSGNDDKLMLYAACTDAGFVIFEFGKKVAED